MPPQPAVKRKKEASMLAQTALSLLLFTLPPSDPDNLAPGTKLQAGGEVIDIRVGHLVPAAADWNGDGKVDLLVGQFMGGKIALYLNQSDKGQPVLRKERFLKAGGKAISLPAG
jgi:hypothetical protein